MFGLFLKMHDRLALVVGGGDVGRRKVRALRAGGADVRVVCLEGRHEEADERVEWLTQPYEARHLDGASLVIAAATREVNARVVADARERGVWVCDAADPDKGDFVTPGTVAHGDVRIAITTGVPALTKRLRERLEEVGREYSRWAELLRDYRPRILAEVPAERREALWEVLIGDEWLDRLRHREVDAEIIAEVEELVRRFAGVEEG